MSNQIVTDLENLASNKAAEKDLKAIGLKILTHTVPMTIQVQIKKVDGEDVSLEDCAKLTEPLNVAFEGSNLLKEPYILEITSPGLSNFLQSDRDFKTFKGFPIEVRFRNKQNSELSKSGLLHERSKEYLLINIKGRMIKIPREDVIRVQLTSPTG